jgi:hypothetical protein
MQLIFRNLLPSRALTWRGVFVVMVLAVLVPLLVQFIPWAGNQPLSVHLLAGFWVVFAAVYLFGSGAGLLAAAAVIACDAMGWFNAGASPGGCAFEIGGFVVVAALLVSRWPSMRTIAPIAWVAGSLAALLVRAVWPGSVPPGDPVESFLLATSTSLAGLGALLTVNTALVALLPKDESWDAD